MSHFAQVVADRVARDAARQRLDAHYHAIKDDIQQRGLRGRIAEEVAEQARAMFDEAVAVAEDHPAAVGGTFAALVLWFLRNPIVAWVSSAFSSASR